MVAWSTRNHLSFIRCMERVSSKTCRGWKFISNQQRSATSDVHQRTTSLLEQNNKRILNALTLPLTREKLLAKRYGNRRYQERNRLQNGQPQNYSQHHNEQSSIHYTESDFVEVKPDMGSARVIFGHMPFGQLPPAQVLTNQHPESIETIYITVIREPLTRIISHYNYLHPALSFRLWYKKHVQHQACNLQVAYLAGLHPSGPLNVNHNHCKAVHDYHVAHACYHLLRNISVVGIHEYHHEFEKTLLQTLGALDHEVAIALNSYHVTPLEHRHSIKQHSTSNNTFQHISLQDIDITTLEEVRFWFYLLHLLSVSHFRSIQ